MRRALAGRHDAPERIDGVDFCEQLGKFRAHYHYHCLERTRPYPRVLEGLVALAPRPMAIVSNKPEPMCVTIVEGLGMQRWLRTVVGARPDVPVKPDPALLRIALDCLGIDEPDPAVWMVGDSPNDVRAARALGLTAVAVDWGLTPLERLEAVEPDAVVSSFDELVELAVR